MIRPSHLSVHTFLGNVWWKGWCCYLSAVETLMTTYNNAFRVALSCIILGTIFCTELCLSFILSHYSFCVFERWNSSWYRPEHQSRICWKGGSETCWIYRYVCKFANALVWISGYQVSLVVSRSSSQSDDRGLNPAPTTGGHLRSRVR